MTRPLTIPRIGTTLTSRSTPLPGTEAEGFGNSEPFASKDANWCFGYNGDWVAHLNATSWCVTDDWLYSGAASHVAGLGLAFTVGGTLAQRPVQGGVYMGRAGRIDASVTGLSAPVFNFTANATNYVWMRPSSTRSAYPDVALTTVNVSPGTGYELLRETTTNATQVTFDTPGTGLLIGYFRNGYHKWTASTGGTSFDFSVGASLAPGFIITAQAGATNVLFQLVTNSTQQCMTLTPLGAGTVGIDANVDSSGVIAFRAKATVNTTDTAAFVEDTTTASQSWGLVLKPHSADPGQGANFVNYVRLYGRGAFLTGGFRWRDGNAGTYGGSVWTPHAYRGSPVASKKTGSDQALGSGAAAVLVTTDAITFRTDHVYIIDVECEALVSATFTCTVNTTITIAGTADTDWNAKAHNVAATGLNGPWLSTRIYYTHTAADVSSTVSLSIAHSAGASTSTYKRPRIRILGPFNVA